MKEGLKSICDQLIESDDLFISEQIAKELDSSLITVQICKDSLCEIKIYSKNSIPISDIIPILGDFGFKILNEVTYQRELNGNDIFVTKLKMAELKESLLQRNRVNIKDMLLRVLKGEVESGKLLALVYFENFSHREILVSRAFGNYAEQVILGFNKSLLEDCILRYPNLFSLFLRYFLTKFDPQIENRDIKISKVKKDIDEAFKEVVSINDDRVLKSIYEILQSSVRTNYFMNKDTVSIKFDVSMLSHIVTSMQPKYEIFVYSYGLKGTHLRTSKVARGGIRWSSRVEDFRTEVKSLMITQEAKNSIIVPKGAKGGFIIREDRPSYEKFKVYYSSFIEALLDVVDNKKDEKIIRDTNQVIYDGDDPYFVVAADRGTSNMSDIANQIAKKRDFWLDDAFASGSSNGYHHKKLGITAKGALKAVERFFIERGINFYKEPISIVGVGSMSGDVFGNALLQSKNFRLIAAISSSEIFIDPNPDLLDSFNERKRLFFAKKKRWSEYDKSKISKGGGVFSRFSKNIPLSVEIQTLLKSKRKYLSAEELAKELLKLPVDLLYFGGVGTYVKSTVENSISIGDKENEFVRVDADKLRAKVVCEGANLAFTMSARIEYALNGGKINLDSVDNSAGVDISDREVNLKILLNSLIKKEAISEDDKNRTLHSVSDNVVNSVLWTNYLQSLSISLDSIRSKRWIESFKKSLVVLENNLPLFKRRYFNIPKDHDIEDVTDTNHMLIRPVIATMTLYAKILLQDILNRSDIYQDDTFFQKYLFKYFPKSLVSIYEDEIVAHPLKKEITSMVIANKIINQTGVTFVDDLDELGVEKFLLKIKSYLITNQLFDANDIRYEIYRGDYNLDIKKQYEMLLKIEDEITYNVEWMLKSAKKEEITFSSILEHKLVLKEIVAEFVKPKENYIRSSLESLRFLKFSFIIIKIKLNSKKDFKETAKLFYALILKFDIPFLIEKLDTFLTKSTTQKQLKTQIKQLLDSSLVDLSEKILRFKRDDEGIDSAILGYFKEHGFDIGEYKETLKAIKSRDTISFDDISVALNYLLLLR